MSHHLDYKPNFYILERVILKYKKALAGLIR